MATSHSEPRAAWLKKCVHAWPSPGISESGMSSGSVGRGAGMLHCHLSAWWPCSLTVGGDTHTRGWAASGTTLRASSLAIVTQQGGGIAQGESWALLPKPQGPCGSDELHGELRGAYIPGCGVQGHCDKKLVTVPQVTMVPSQIPPRSMSGLTAW